MYCLKHGFDFINLGLPAYCALGLPYTSPHKQILRGFLYLKWVGVPPKNGELRQKKVNIAYSEASDTPMPRPTKPHQHPATKAKDKHTLPLNFDKIKDARPTNIKKV